MRCYASNAAVCLLLAVTASAAPRHDHTVTAVTTTTTATTTAATVASTASMNTGIGAAPSTNHDIEPCWRISKLYDDGHGSVPAELAYQCLQSVPLDLEGDMKLIDEIGAYFEWQSNQAYLANPPPYYDNPKLDVVGGLNSIRRKLNSSAYSGEYEFAVELYDLTLRSQDNHFVYMPDILYPFTFQREVLLTSVSVDGLSLPQIFVYGDILPRNGATNFGDRSPVTHVNAVEVQEYLNSLPPFRDNGQWHDADARYNSLFTNQVAVFQGSDTPSFTTEYHYVGASTGLTFANGTTKHYRNIATIFSDFSDVQDGKSYFKKFCSGKNVDGASTTAPGIPGEPNEVGYPEALKSAAGVNVYHLTSMADTIVISVPTFEIDDVPALQKLLRWTIAYSETHNITKTVIDLRDNGGGYVFAAYAFFQELFPTITPFGSHRLRATKVLDRLGLTATQLFRHDTTDEVANEEDEDLSQLVENSYKEYLTIDGNRFTSWQEMFGPHTFNGDAFTSLMMYNVSDPSITEDINMTQYLYINATRSPPTSSFDPKKIVMVQDGGCSSTCSLFAEMMKTQGKVQTIAIGGRPHHGPMQGIGGTKGAEVIDFTTIHMEAKAAYEKSDNRTRTEMLEGNFGVLIKGGKPLERAAMNDGSPWASVNLRDNIRKGDTSQTPLEFVYEAADCRLFYTADMVLDVKETWRRVAAAQWGSTVNGSSPLCVKGSTGHPSAQSRDGVPWAVADQANGTLASSSIIASSTRSSVQSSSGTSRFAPSPTSTGNAPPKATKQPEEKGSDNAASGIGASSLCLAAALLATIVA